MSNYTAPIKIGTQYVQAEGNSEIHYLVGFVKLYDAPGLSVNPEPEFDSDTMTVKYTYTYTQSKPKKGAKKICLMLSVFLPNEYTAPLGNKELKISVTNTENPDDSKTGTVITSSPPVLPAFPPSTLPLDSTTKPKVDLPRYMVFKSVTTDNDVKTEYYFILVIAKTNKNNQRLMQVNFESGTMACAYIPVPPSAQSNDPEPVAAVTYLSINKDQFDTITLKGNTINNIDLDHPKPTSFNIID